MINKFLKLMDKTSQKIAEKITKKEVRYEDIEDILFEFQYNLLELNVALEVTEKIIEAIKNEIVGKVVEKKKIKNIIKDIMLKEVRSIVKEEDIDNLIDPSVKPYTILVFGFNGTGKTTTLAKLANYLLNKEKTVVFAAGDTFRSAAIEQLSHHAEKLGIKIIKQNYKSDSAAVIYDAKNYAISKGIDFVLGDTAGRAPTDKNLIEELKKIVRVIKPDLRILVVESISGNNIIEQINVFNEVGYDAVVVSKYDVDDKKGGIISVCYASKKPIIFLGTGQNYEDFKKFSKEEYIKEIFS